MRSFGQILPINNNGLGQLRSPVSTSFVIALGIGVIIAIIAAYSFPLRPSRAVMSPEVSAAEHTASGGNSDEAVEAASTTQASTESQAQANSSTQLTVNGQDIPVPADGSIDKTITTQGGQTHIHVSAGSGSHTTSVNSQVNSSGDLSTQFNIFQRSVTLP